MEGRPRKMKLELEGVPGAVMWSEDMPREKAARELIRIIAPDTVLPLRVYVAAPEGTGAQKLGFGLQALDAEGGVAHYASRFDAPEPAAGQ